MGGIGKTTLAQRVYSHGDVECHFDKRLWICVSDPFDEMRIAKEILEAFRGECPKLVGKDNILQEIRSCVLGKKTLLVLDDVWTEDATKWEQLKKSLKYCSLGSRILITTRNEKVAIIMGTPPSNLFLLNTLSQEECLPLAAKILGGLLRFKKTREQWQLVLDSEIWDIEEAEQDLFPPLSLSYYELPLVLKQCISYCVVFPKDTIISKDELIKLWMAQDYLKGVQGEEMEIVGEEYFDELKMRSFFQDFKRMNSTMVLNSIEELPDEIGKLVHLRYLNLKNNRKLKELPESLCELCNLQTLNLKWCDSLKELPCGVGKIINLRHLENERTDLSLKAMPKGIGRLTNLQTLSVFAVADSNNAATLGDLQNLMHLRGLLKISGLGAVCDMAEAKKAELQKKQGLRTLILDFTISKGVMSRRRQRTDDEKVLEALQPPPCLEKLEIWCYSGPTMFPNWMMGLTKLNHISLGSCLHLKSLPPLGTLPSLESLYIGEMSTVKVVEVQFLGVEREETSALPSSLETPSSLLLPSLNVAERRPGRIGCENFTHSSIIIDGLCIQVNNTSVEEFGGYCIAAITQHVRRIYLSSLLFPCGSKDEKDLQTTLETPLDNININSILTLY
ncbi:hypothetical protein GQ457_HM002050 [Hibiscus cannabinus]